jgi:hypothetical protein
MVPSGKHRKNDGKSSCLMDKSSISMAIFNSKLLVNQRGNHQTLPLNPIKTPLNLIKSH